MASRSNIVSTKESKEYFDKRNCKVGWELLRIQWNIPDYPHMGDSPTALDLTCMM